MKREMSRPALPIEGPTRHGFLTRDGVELVADIWKPAGSGRYPVMLMRQPYGRRIASTIVLAHPAWYAAQGYVVVIQDVRGCGDSGGRFSVLSNEAEDGAETLAWAAELPFGTGQVATYGFSYQAMTQYLALAGARKAGTKLPDAMVPVMGGWNIETDWAYEGGAFRMALHQNWALQMAAEQARRAGDMDEYQDFLNAAEQGVHFGPRPAYAEILDRADGHIGHYGDWREGRAESFASIAPETALSADPLDIPALHVAGWLDFMFDGTLAAYRAFQARSAAPQRLIVGPWAHLPWGRHVGVDLGEAAGDGVDADIVAFLDHHLKGVEQEGPPCRLFDLGANCWRDLARFPEHYDHSLFLSSDGRAATTTTAGTLARAPDGEAQDFVVHDPWRPAPAVGLHWAFPGVYCDRRVADDRTDVAVYTTAPLEAELRLAGPVAAELHVGSDCPSHDLNCTLSVIRPDGTALTLTGGHLRVADSAAPGARLVAMRAVCATVPAGARLRLSIQMAAWPTFAINPGTGVRPEQAARGEAAVTTIDIRSGTASPSRLVLTRGD
ncbi:CocE/NonD family hydrolase [Psychromarinibacter sp. S121]|uniref:CocE/NonD family hydrolase n=1 Tax=Psychromarinibacter sp. S121 TaxID=3415127 RepID=UPI003C7AF44E